MANWHKLVAREMEVHGESWNDVISHTFGVGRASGSTVREFDDDYGYPSGKPFTVWTHNRVYFPTCYDGAEGVASVSRWADGQPTEHVGGW